MSIWFNTRKLIVFAALMAIVALVAGPVPAEEVERPHVRAELVSEFQEFAPGKPISAALRIVPEKDWHVYWRYAGDSGTAPKFKWWLNNVEVSAEQFWPTPERIEVGPFVNYGYSSETLFLASLALPDALHETETLTIKLDAEWLVCKVECIPGYAILEQTLPVKPNGGLTPSSRHNQFASTRESLPGSTLEPTRLTLLKSGEELVLRLAAETDPITKLAFLPSRPGLIENGAKQKLLQDVGQVELRLATATNFDAGDGYLEGILIKEPVWPDQRLSQSIRVQLPAGLTPADSAPAQSAPAVSELSLWFALLTAFIGGLILNLMPCVFPVLSIKILGFVQKAGKDTRAIKNHGLAFGVGILASFWAFAFAIRAFQAAGEGLGWGFQLQDPSFVAFLVLLLIVVALNLFGVFEVGGSLQRLGGKASGSGDSYLASFGSGVLATILATPCTAPFMGAAIAYGLANSLLVTLLVFTFLAIGLAAPYLILSFYPAWLARLPKPGEWMNTFKQLMGFPILLTALWLLWVFEQQSSTWDLFVLLAACVLISFTFWLFGLLAQPQKSRLTRYTGTALLLLGLCASGALAVPGNAPTVSKDGGLIVDQYGLSWHEYGDDVIARLVAEGRPVYVDFTASWCVTCQVNKKVVFSSEEVRNTIRAKNIALVRADWTNKDPKLAEALARFGRAGVPLNVLHFPSSEREPIVLPALLTPSIVLDRFAQI